MPKQIKDPNKLTKAEFKQLIKEVNQDFTAAKLHEAEGRAKLLRIYNDDVHWREMASTWIEFGRLVWPDFTRMTISRAVSQAEFEQETPALTGIPQSHAKAMAAVPLENREEVYKIAKDNAEGIEPTTKEVEAAIEEFQDANPFTKEANPNAETATENGGPSGLIGIGGGQGGGDPAARNAAADRDEEKRGLALDRIRKLLGKTLADALRNKDIDLSTKELCFWADLTDEGAKSIQELVAVKRWQPSKAWKWINAMPDSSDKFSEFHNRALADRNLGFYTATIDGCLAIFIARDDLKHDAAAWAAKHLKALK